MSKPFLLFRVAPKRILRFLLSFNSLEVQCFSWNGHEHGFYAYYLALFHFSILISYRTSFKKHILVHHHHHHQNISFPLLLSNFYVSKIPNPNKMRMTLPLHVALHPCHCIYKVQPNILYLFTSSPHQSSSFHLPTLLLLS